MCRECRETQLVASNLEDDCAKVSSLYEYTGALRELIISAKVKNDWQTLKGLGKLFCVHPLVLREVQRADVVTPAPSSMWGRVRGRFDLAEHLALEVERESGKPLVSLPVWSYLRWSKRANRNNEDTDFNEINHKPSILFKDKKVLLIDDILTTGKTIKSLKRILFRLGAAEVSVVLLSSSPGFGETASQAI